jgi:hypothetical protein
MGERSESGRVLLLVGMFVLLATSLRAQETLAKPGSDSSSNRETTPLSKPKPKPSLLDATRVSTEEAAKSAAQEKADKAPGEKTNESSSSESVTEFHPARPDSAQKSGAAATTSDDSKASVLKRVHGKVESSAAIGASGDRGGGASVGATSNSGKTAVYVERDRSRSDTPH